jgi:hypothetical protein
MNRAKTNDLEFASSTQRSYTLEEIEQRIKNVKLRNGKFVDEKSKPISNSELYEYFRKYDQIIKELKSVNNGK